MRNLGDGKCNVILAVALLYWLSNWDGIPHLQQSSNVVEFGGGLIGGLTIVLIGLALRGIAWLYYQITKDSIENEEEKTYFWKPSMQLMPRNLTRFFWP